MLVSIVYMSRAVVPFDDDALAVLLAESRLRNEALGVSGLLLAKGGRFMQLLEGPAWSVDDRFAVIAKDPRHGEVKSLVREDIERRRFDGWSMAYRALDDADVRSEEGFSPFLSGTMDFPRSFDRTSAAWLLKWFRDRELHELP
ncbi:BLUF domain-containing protein [Curtobacterium oceanosedimentum]|uniref:BLUF domain-containing protein n=1 Tax=Curtobacterium oceanosedimentum TaxID=465820 RepID=UPI001CE1DB84|nr:BLUF domain-containing protein [Curtobacterium oceanosedimentum]MCA5921983.1 BLUF domain-containing protein [Curtobacterium oceanosedimentum]